MKESIIALFAVYQEAQNKAKALKAQLSDIELEVDLAKAALMKAVKPNTARDGVFHKQFERKSVSYSSALTTIREALVPKTKQGEVDAILAENTKITLIDSFEVVKS